MTPDNIRYDTLTGPSTDAAAAFLQGGDVVAIPTETVYGLAGNALDPTAVLKIFSVKNRPAFDPLIVHVPNADAVEIYAAEFPAAARILASHFWPGPLTLLLPKRSLIPDLVTSGLSRVALRMPAHPLALELLSKLSFPLAAPSANPFGYVSPTTAQHVFDQLQGRIPYILDGGSCQVGIESTIVGFENERPVVYRLGGLSIEALSKVAGKVELQLNQSSNPAAPGMLKSHYAPRKPLYRGDLDENLKRFAGRKIGVMTFRRRDDLPADITQIALSEAGDLFEAARNLFAALRAFDASTAEVILAENAPDEGLGRAINDRLRRAAV